MNRLKKILEEGQGIKPVAEIVIVTLNIIIIDIVHS
jgi:hypothetical protein